MAANFWFSSHSRNWLFTKDAIQQFKAKQAEHTSVELEKLHRQMVFAIQVVGSRMLKYDQIVVATAAVFFKRFSIIKNENATSDMRVAAVSALYLAAKVEELGPIHASDLVERFKQLKRTHDLPVKMDLTLHEVFAMERVMVQRLDFDLVVFHPYSDLERFISDFSSSYGIDAAREGAIVQLAWTITNDSQRCDCALIYPPFVTALACIYLACAALKLDKVDEWFSKINVQPQQVRECAEDILQGSIDDRQMIVKI